MANIIFFDDDGWKSLLPLTFLKPASKLLVGILSIEEKWSRLLDSSDVSHITNDYLSSKFPLKIGDNNIVINGRLLPNKDILSLLKRLDTNMGLIWNDIFLGGVLSKSQFDESTYDIDMSEMELLDISSYDSRFIKLITRPQDIFIQNASEIESDYQLITASRQSAPIGNQNWSLVSDQIFIEEGAKVDFSILNATDGPIYIGHNAKILENSVIKGPVAICENAVVKVGAKIYQGTTIGYGSKVGGEVKSTVFSSHSNKSHDGYLGDSVIGDWCNLGANTNCSNLKNNYSEVKAYSYNTDQFESTGLQFCGLIMGDHSKAGISTMFNTGTTVGIASNIFGGGYQPKFIPSFAWGGSGGLSTYQFDKAMESVNRVLQRRNQRLEQTDIEVFKHIFDESNARRTWQDQ